MNLKLIRIDAPEPVPGPEGEVDLHPHLEQHALHRVTRQVGRTLRSRFDAALAKVPDREPDPQDR